MDILRVKKELDDEEISIEYNDIAKNHIHPVKIKTEPKVISNKTNRSENKLSPKFTKIDARITNIPLQDNSEPTKTSTPCTSIVFSDITKALGTSALIEEIPIKRKKATTSGNNVTNLEDHHNKLPSPSYTRPVRSLPFTGARFLHAQVHSNPLLQLLLKDIISLNNEKDEIDEDAISQEVAKLRSKNNLPSLNAEVPINLDLEDSDYSEVSEDESYNYYNSKSPENYGKDSGYDNESQHSESFEDDNRSEIQENLGNETEKSLVIAEPEYIDLDNYYDKKKRKLPAHRGSLTDIRTVPRSSQRVTESTNFNGFTCPYCNKTLKSKKTYKHHTKNGTGCITKPKESRLFNCLRNCKFLGTKDEFLKHKQEKHRTPSKNGVKDKTVLPLTCEKCHVKFLSAMSLERHTKTHSKQKMACLFCDFVCSHLTEYNLHVSSQHSKREKKESSSDSDCLQIIEIENDG